MDETAHRQAALLARLLGEGDTPEGFDEERVALTAEILAHKRARRCRLHAAPDPAPPGQRLGWLWPGRRRQP